MTTSNPVNPSVSKFRRRFRRFVMKKGGFVGPLKVPKKGRLTWAWSLIAIHYMNVYWLSFQLDDVQQIFTKNGWKSPFPSIHLKLVGFRVPGGCMGSTSAGRRLMISRKFLQLWEDVSIFASPKKKKKQED